MVINDKLQRIVIKEQVLVIKEQVFYTVLAN